MVNVYVREKGTQGVIITISKICSVATCLENLRLHEDSYKNALLLCIKVSRQVTDYILFWLIVREMLSFLWLEIIVLYVFL